MDNDTLRRITFLERQVAQQQETLVAIADLLQTLGDQTGSLAELAHMHNVRIKHLEEN